MVDEVVDRAELGGEFSGGAGLAVVEEPGDEDAEAGGEERDGGEGEFDGVGGGFCGRCGGGREDGGEEVLELVVAAQGCGDAYPAADDGEDARGG